MNGLESVCLSHEDPPRPHQPKTSLGLVMIMMMMMMMLRIMMMMMTLLSDRLMAVIIR